MVPPAQHVSDDELNEDVDTLSYDESGLEAELDRGSEIEVPFDPTKIDIIVKPMTLGALQDRLENGELDLTPEFQRQANLWNAQRKSRLIESILLRIPLPSFYFSEDDNGVYAVVDGLQRLCSVFHFKDPGLLERATSVELKPLRLVGLQYLKEMEEKAYDELDRKYRRRISELEITANIIRAATPAAVKFNVFARLNQGGMPLNAQEIRNAIFPGAWRGYIREMAEGGLFLEITEQKIRKERQQDMELVLRYVALIQLESPFHRPSNQNLDEFLNSVVEGVLSRWSDRQWNAVARQFRRNLYAVKKIFGVHAFRKSYGNQRRKPINRGLFEAQLIASAMMTDEDVEQLAKRSHMVTTEFGKLMSEQSDFIRALLYGTGSAEASNVRIDKMKELLFGVLYA